MRQATRAYFLVSKSRIARVLSASSVSSFSSSWSYARRVHAVLPQPQLGDLPLERVALLEQRAQRRDRRAGRRGARALRREKQRRRQLALAAVVERRVLGQDVALLLVGGLDLGGGVIERLEHRHAAVAIAVGGVVVERLDEVLGEARLVALAAGLGRGDDGPRRPGQRLQKRAARARGVDEDDLLRRELASSAA